MSKFTVAVKPTQGGDRFNVEVSSESSVSEFKEEVNRVREVPVAEQRIIYKGQVLKDERTVGSYGEDIARAASYHLVISLGFSEGCRALQGSKRTMLCTWCGLAPRRNPQGGVLSCFFEHPAAM